MAAAAEGDRGLPIYFVIALIAMVVPITFEVGGLFLTCLLYTSDAADE